MNHIVFIIILFLILFKTFALKSSSNCDDLYFDSIKFLADHKVELTINGPDKVENPGSFSCCLKQGLMMISNYAFYKYNNPSPFYTVISNLTWVNGYTKENILNANDCLSKSWGEYFDCSKIHEGQRDYTRTDNYDPTNFPSPGDYIGVAFNIYAHCFNHYETVCLKYCEFSGGITYDPPK